MGNTVGSYLQTYGAGDERRIRIIKTIVFTVLGAIVLAVGGYMFYHDYPEKQAAKRFLAEVNSQQYQAAYRDWGCTAEHPCPNYDFGRFMQDWGAAKNTAASWRVASVDGCTTFVTVNVQADGSDLQSLAVARNDNALGFAPAPECQERRLHLKQFFSRLFGRGGGS